MGRGRGSRGGGDDGAHGRLLGGDRGKRSGGNGKLRRFRLPVQVRREHGGVHEPGLFVHAQSVEALVLRQEPVQLQNGVPEGQDIRRQEGCGGQDAQLPVFAVAPPRVPEGVVQADELFRLFLAAALRHGQNVGDGLEAVPAGKMPAQQSIALLHIRQQRIVVLLGEGHEAGHDAVLPGGQEGVLLLHPLIQAPAPLCRRLRLQGRDQLRIGDRQKNGILVPAEAGLEQVVHLHDLGEMLPGIRRNAEPGGQRHLHASPEIGEYPRPGLDDGLAGPEPFLVRLDAPGDEHVCADGQQIAALHGIYPLDRISCPDEIQAYALRLCQCFHYGISLLDLTTGSIPKPKAQCKRLYPGEILPAPRAASGGRKTGRPKPPRGSMQSLSIRRIPARSGTWPPRSPASRGSGRSWS